AVEVDVVVEVPTPSVGPANLVSAPSRETVEEAEVGEVATRAGDSDEVSRTKGRLGVGSGRRSDASPLEVHSRGGDPDQVGGALAPDQSSGRRRRIPDLSVGR